MLTTIQQIAVVGAGTMGAGIAQLSAMAGYPTILFDIQETALTKALYQINQNLEGAIQRNKISKEVKQDALNKIRTTTNLKEVKGSIIIEAIVEKLTPKVTIFQTLADHNPSTTIFATNTSSIPITKIAAAIPHPERVVGMHFFNPAHIMKLVEVVSGAATSEKVVTTIYELAQKMGKKPVLARDAPGFIVNRVARPFYLESQKVVEENVTDFATVDDLLEASGFKMGAFRLMDLIGIDVNFSVTTSMFEAFYYESRFQPNNLQAQKVAAGHWGRKTGSGFYEY